MMQSIWLDMNSMWRSLGVACLLTGWIPGAHAQLEPGAERVRVRENPTLVQDFELIDQDGESFRFSRLRDAPALVFFGFTHCPQICPAAMLKLRHFADAERRAGTDVTAIVMISVDGTRDTPGTMKAYLEQFSTEFIGLTGDPKAVRRIAEQFSAVFFKGLPEDSSGRYLVEHTGQIYLVDAQGRLRATFFDPPVEQMSRVVHEVLREQSVSRAVNAPL